MKDSPTCSRCGASRGLNLVTLHYSIDSPSGRILVYCAPCRENYRDHIGESIPLEQVSKEGFLELYRSNKTSSDPQTAVEIVFGKKISIWFVKQCDCFPCKVMRNRMPGKKFEYDRSLLRRAFVRRLTWRWVR
jgi:hypothetical protein